MSARRNATEAIGSIELDIPKHARRKDILDQSAMHKPRQADLHEMYLTLFLRLFTAATIVPAQSEACLAYQI